jgi:hypothetical protein
MKTWVKDKLKFFEGDSSPSEIHKKNIQNRIGFDSRIDSLEIKNVSTGNDFFDEEERNEDTGNIVKKTYKERQEFKETLQQINLLASEQSIKKEWENKILMSKQYMSTDYIPKREHKHDNMKTSNFENILKKINSSSLNSLDPFSFFENDNRNIKVLNKLHSYKTFDFTWPLFYEDIIQKKKKLTIESFLKIHAHYTTEIFIEWRGIFFIKKDNLLILSFSLEEADIFYLNYIFTVNNISLTTFEEKKGKIPELYKDFEDKKNVPDQLYQSFMSLNITFNKFFYSFCGCKYNKGEIDE